MVLTTRNLEAPICYPCWWCSSQETLQPLYVTLADGDHHRKPCSPYMLSLLMVLITRNLAAPICYPCWWWSSQETVQPLYVILADGAHHKKPCSPYMLSLLMVLITRNLAAPICYPCWWCSPQETLQHYTLPLMVSTTRNLTAKENMHHRSVFLYGENTEIKYRSEYLDRNTIGILRGYAIRSGKRPEGSQRPLTSRGTSAWPYRVTMQYSFYPVQIYS